MVKKNQTGRRLRVGDMVRIEKAAINLGFIIELSDTWTPSKQHHASIFWIAGDYAAEGAPTSWVPIDILECVSKG